MDTHVINEPTQTEQREGIIQIMRQNRKVVAEQLSRRLFTRQRPTPAQLESRGIVPVGYFTQGYVCWLMLHLLIPWTACFVCWFVCMYAYVCVCVRVCV